MSLGSRSGSGTGSPSGSGFVFDGQEGVRVLVVEDSEDYARLVASTLERSPLARFDVERVASLDEALASVEGSHYDAMLLDLSLPDGCGAFTVAFGCAIADRLPIVVLTATDDDELAMTAVRAGAQEYLVKDRVDGHEVPSAVLRAIERRRRLMLLGARGAAARGATLAAGGREGPSADPVTGAPTRAAFHDRIADAIARSRRSGELVAVLVIGLDHFDVLHDMLGDATFDELVCVAAERIGAHTRRGNVFARIGPQTFGVLLECVPAEADAARAASGLVEALESVRIATPSGVELRTVSASIGVAFHPADADEADALVARAEQAHVRAAAADGSRVRLFASPGAD